MNEHIICATAKQGHMIIDEVIYANKTEVGKFRYNEVLDLNYIDESKARGAVVSSYAAKSEY